MLYGNAGIIDLHNLSVLNKSIVPHFDNINNLIYDILGGDAVMSFLVTLLSNPAVMPHEPSKPSSMTSIT